MPIAGTNNATCTIDPGNPGTPGARDVAVYGSCHATVPTMSRVAMLTRGSMRPADLNQDGGVHGGNISPFFAA